MVRYPSILNFHFPLQKQPVTSLHLLPEIFQPFYFCFLKFNLNSQKMFDLSTALSHTFMCGWCYVVLKYCYLVNHNKLQTVSTLLLLTLLQRTLLYISIFLYIQVFLQSKLLGQTICTFLILLAIAKLSFSSNSHSI